jgi:hypothetical protein
VIARYARPAMARIWSDESKLARWLDVELAALEGWAEVGAIPTEDVAEIRTNAAPPTPQRVAEIERVTDHDVAAFVDAVAEQLGPTGRWVHHGLTSSDVVDTALSLQIQDAGRLVLEGIDRSLEAVVALADKHRAAICIGRSHGIHAEPTTFGWKLAGWAFELDRTRTRIARALEANRVGQLSGTVGTYAQLDPEVERIACERLGLEPDPLSTQVIARDRHASCSTRSRSPRPRSSASRRRSAILARTEVREVEEPFAQGMKGSSRCRTSGIRRSPSGSAGSRASSRERARRDGERAALARARHLPVFRRARSSCRTPSSRSTTCSTASTGSSTGSSSIRSGCAATSTRATGSSSATACCSHSSSPGSPATRRTEQSSPTRCAHGKRRPTSPSSSAPTATLAGRVDLDAVFDLDATVRHVDTVFDRLHALVRKEEPVHA